MQALEHPDWRLRLAVSISDINVPTKFSGNAAIGRFVNAVGDRLNMMTGTRMRPRDHGADTWHHRLDDEA